MNRSSNKGTSTKAKRGNKNKIQNAVIQQNITIVNSIGSTKNTLPYCLGANFDRSG